SFPAAEPQPSRGRARRDDRRPRICSPSPDDVRAGAGRARGLGAGLRPRTRVDRPARRTQRRRGGHTGGMRIAMLAAGSRGDYQPVVAVGRALAARGHDVGVTVTSDYVDLVRAGGLRPEEVRFDLMERYREDVLSGEGMPDAWEGQLGIVGEMARVLAPEVTRTLHDLSPRYDGFVTTALTATWPGLFLDGPRRRQVLMMFVPALPSVWGDSSLFSVEEGRSWRNLAAGLRVLRSARGAVAPRGADAAGVDVGVRARARASWQMMTAPAFVAMTPQLVTPRRVGGRDVRVVGYPVAPLPAGSSLPAEVEAFLAAG